MMPFQSGLISRRYAPVRNTSQRWTAPAKHMPREKNDYKQCSLGETENIIGIACGPMHTVLIGSDGIVTVKGVSNAFEDSLKDISDAVSASSSWSHLVVQHSDGSLSAYGANERGQCAVSDWTDIAFYTARANFTVGVKADTSVVTTVAGHSLDWQVLIWK